MQEARQQEELVAWILPYLGGTASSHLHEERQQTGYGKHSCDKTGSTVHQDLIEQFNL